jgi:Alpha-N-acetylglucosaminidase (NAGLU).
VQLRSVQAAIQRILGDKANYFTCELIPKANGKEVCEIESKAGKIILKGSSPTAIGYALNRYITNRCHGQLSRAGEQLSLSLPLPAVSEKIHCESPFEWRYFYNYCTYNYTMSFWDWNRWEKEIDWLFLHGVNMPLAIIGTEAVWQNTLRRFNVPEDAIAKFIPGPAYTAWWLMGNLEGWGGPVSQAWIDHQAALQQKIVARMRQLGMTPIFQGFYGMMPDTLRTLFPKSKMYYGGLWAGKHGFQRPAYLDPSDSLFARMASVFYKEQEKLYGKTTVYGGDPFHEGGNTEGIDITRSATLIQQAMQKAHPGSVWALQGWWENPTDKLLAGIDKRHALILDLYAEGNPQWERRQGYDGTPWAWCCLLNFGGRIGMYSRLPQLAGEPARALSSSYGKNLKGIGMMMEGDETNPVNYELLFDAAWSNQPVDLAKWLNNFVLARYGTKDTNAEQAWDIISKTALSCPYGQEGTSQSIFCGRGDTINMNAWPYGTLKLYYAPEQLQKALALLLRCSDNVKKSDTYQYDIADITRQLLANYGQELYLAIIDAYKQNKLTDYQLQSKQFIDLLDDQEKILSTRKEFLLGTWIASAKSCAPTEADRDLFEFNAKALISVWGNKGVSEDLHDYANREWAGMIGSLYKARWQAFFNVLKQRLKGNPLPLPDYYAIEDNWTKQKTVFTTQPVGDSFSIANQLYAKYCNK